MALVTFREVEKTFWQDRDRSYTALLDFSLEIEEGEFFCLLGPTGCGKTTVLNLLAGFEAQTRGTIELAGAPIAGPGRDRAVVFQGDDSLYAWLTARENIAFGPRMRGVPSKARREQSEHYLDLVGLRGQGDKYPHELSGGMKQRIQIARVLANEPKMLLMDEPFGALDAQTRRVMQRELGKIWQATHKSVLFITHDIDEAITLGTRIGVMYAGPGSRLKEIISVDVALGYDRSHPRFIEYYKLVHALIEDEVNKTLLREIEAQTDLEAPRGER
jgi:NitT/TauT family transport system ATP-binding protein